MEVTFKKATLEEVEGIICLCNACFNEETPLEFAIDVFKKTENDENQIYVVGIVNDEIVAHCKITIIPTMYEDMGCYAILNHVCVREDMRRHNLATKMLDEVFRICKEKNCNCVELWSKNFRKAAHACYKKYGFSVVDAAFFAKDIM